VRSTALLLLHHVERAGALDQEVGVKIGRKFRRRLRCLRRGHRWHVYYGYDDLEQCDRCGKCRSADTQE